MSDQTTPPASAVDFEPIACLDVELTAADEHPGGPGGSAVLARVHGVPVAEVSLPPGTVASATTVMALLDEADQARLMRHLAEDGVADLAAAAGVTCAYDVVPQGLPRATAMVATIGRQPLLRACLDSLLASDHPDFEVILLDNAPSTGVAAAMVEEIGDPRLRYVAAPRRGKSRAFNVGFDSATGEIVACTDDDAVADSTWLRRMATPFARSARVGAVTGLVVSSEFATRAQVLFEQAMGFDKGLDPLVWAIHPQFEDAELAPLGEPDGAFPFSLGRFGSGNSVALRRQRWIDLGGFDEALGPGTPALGAEDLDAFLRVLMSGDVLVYQPAAVVRHQHRRDADALASQVHDYGIGLSALMTKVLVRDRRGRGLLLRKIPAGFRRLLDPSSEKNEAKTDEFPPGLTRTEFTGLAKGPYRYARSVSQARRTQA